MFISLVSVVKNEASVVGRLIDSVQGPAKFWDEIVFTDTGSTDGTVDLLRARGVRVVEAAWPDSFAAARNMAAANASPQADLVVNFDGDELLGPGGERLRSRIEDAWARGKRMMSIRYEWAHDEFGNPIVIYPRQCIWDPRMFRFEGRAHEALEGPLSEATMEHFDDVTLIHRPKPGHAANKGERDLRLLELDVVDRPDRPRGWFYLGRQYTYLARWQEAVDALQSYLRIARWTPERMAARILIGDAMVRLGRPSEALAFYTSSIMEEPERREPYMALCQHFYNLKEWRQCAIWGEAALVIPRHGTTKGFLRQEPCYLWLPHDLLSIAWWNLGDKERGRRHLEEALKFRPTDPRLLENLKWFG